MPRPACPLILIHIPKTAGTTLSRMLRMHFAASPSNWLRHARTLGFYHLGYARPEHLDARLSSIAALPPEKQSHVRFFAAHAGFGIRDRLPEPMRANAGYLTVLREPVARMISTFHHLRSEGRLPRDASLQHYVAQRKHFGLFKFDNCQVRYLAGERGVAVDSPCGSCTRDMLELAKHRLENEVFWFGLTERFDESVLLLADALDTRKPRYVRARVTKNRDRSDAIDDDLLQRIRDFNALDIELHEHAQKVFDQRIRAQGSEFAGRVEAFRVENDRHARVRRPINAAMPRARRILQRMGLLR